MPRKRPISNPTPTPPATETAQEDDADLPEEVLAFLDAEADYQAYKAANESVIRNLIAFANARNAAFEAADKIVRARELQVGPFKFKTAPFTKVDGTKAFDTLGLQNFQAIGGAMKTQVAYVLDARAVEIAIATGRLTEEVAKKFTERQVRYCSIPMVSIP